MAKKKKKKKNKSEEEEEPRFRVDEVVRAPTMVEMGFGQTSPIREFPEKARRQKKRMTKLSKRLDKPLVRGDRARPKTRVGRGFRATAQRGSKTILDLI